jgi:hypothetical protein
VFVIFEYFAAARACHHDLHSTVSISKFMLTKHWPTYQFDGLDKTFVRGFLDLKQVRLYIKPS